MFLTVSPPPKPLRSAVLHDLRAKIARIEHGAAATRPNSTLPLGVAAIDQVLPAGGLRLGALHETVGAGPDTEYAAAATLFIAGLLARLPGPVLWVLRQADLFAPGLAGAGLHPDRVIFAEAGKAYVFRIVEGRAQRAEVTVGQRRPGTAEIRTGTNTVLKYLTKPVIKTLSEAMRER